MQVMFQPKEIFWEKIREKLKQLKINNTIQQVTEYTLYTQHYPQNFLSAVQFLEDVQIAL
jgi:hypothetical protein